MAQSEIKGVEQLVKDLNLYNDEIVDGVANITFRIANKSKNDLQSIDIPQSTSDGKRTKPSIKRKSWRKYSKSWTTLEKKGTNYCRAIVHNKKFYSLAHLLEYGHATANGGRTRSFEHIKPINDATIKIYQKEVESYLKKKGG